MENTKYSITEACKKAGMSRTKFYKDYINTGVISKSKEGKKVFIDASEFNRVFPEVIKKEQMEVKYSSIENIKLQHEKDLIKLELEYTKKQLEDALKDKEHYRQLALEKIEKKSDQVRRVTWFDRIFG